MLLKLKQAVIDHADFALEQLSSVYQAALDVLAEHDLGSHITKNIGYGMGLEFRDSTFLLNAKNERVAKAGMVFNVALGLENLTNKKASDSQSKEYAIFIADTVIDQENGNDAEVATSAAGKEWKDIGYYLQGLDEDEEEAPPEPKEEKRRGREKGPVVLDSTLRSEQGEEAKEARRKQLQDELIEKKNLETVQRLKMASQEKPDKAALGGNADVITYPSVDSLPSVTQLMIQVCSNGLSLCNYDLLRLNEGIVVC